MDLLDRLRAEAGNFARGHDTRVLFEEAVNELARLQNLLLWTYANADEYSTLLSEVVRWTQCDRANRGDGPADGFKSREEHATRLQQLGLALLEDARRQKAERDRLRAALAGVTGGTDVTRAELEQMELVVRASAVAAEDKASALDAIHALLATAP